MTTQEFIAAETARASEALIHQATRMPDGKAEWAPMDEGRTALDQVAECALIGESMPGIIANRKMPDFTPEMMEQYERDKKAMDLQTACDRLRAATDKICEAIRATPDASLAESMSFWGPEPWTVAAVLNFHNWNMTYHCGQVNYIQTLYGDKAMG